MKLRLMVAVLLVFLVGLMTSPVHGVENTANLSILDADGDFLFVDQPLYPGQTLFRPNDGETQVEERNYLVPNNLFFVDHNGDGVLDTEPIRSAVVVVIADNLTWLFGRNELGQVTDQVIGVFPNGTGRPGANTVASLRVIDKVLGEQFGWEESTRRDLRDAFGQIVNAFGIITLGTSYYVSDSEMVTTFQEVHGTPNGWEFLLGTEVSGGCTRHRNVDIVKIRDNTQVGDFVATVITAADDEFDSPLTLYNATQVAAGRSQAMVPTDVVDVAMSSLVSVPEFYRPMDGVSLEPERGYQWLTWEQVKVAWPEQSVQLARGAHPYTRAEYLVIPCGSETMYLALLYGGHDPVVFDGESYRLAWTPQAVFANGQVLTTEPVSVTPAQLAAVSHRLSSGDERLQAFQYLTAQSVYWISRAYTGLDHIPYASDAEVRQIQLATGLIPFQYSWKGNAYPHQDGDFLAILKNRTLIHALAQFYGVQTRVYELQLNGVAVPVTDMQLAQPSVDHEMISNGESGIVVTSLLQSALSTNQMVILRVTAYAAFTEAIRYEAGLAANHYYVVVPFLSDERYIMVQDTMHPSSLLRVRVDLLHQFFSTATVFSLNT